MRIISQDGTIDINYDLGNLSIAKGADDGITQRSIYFHSCSCPRGTKLATYSTTDKAQKAMDMLRGAYMNHIVFMQLSSEEKALFIKTVREDEHERVYGVFRLPCDEEIEV